MKYYYESYSCEIQSDEQTARAQYEAWQNLSNWEDDEEYER